KGTDMNHPDIRTDELEQLEREGHLAGRPALIALLGERRAAKNAHREIIEARLARQAANLAAAPIQKNAAHEATEADMVLVSHPFPNAKIGSVGNVDWFLPKNSRVGFLPRALAEELL